MERNPSEYSHIVIPQKSAAISPKESAKKEEQYIQKNGLCTKTKNIFMVLTTIRKQRGLLVLKITKKSLNFTLINFIIY